ncbi:MAG TPA: universal stress protein [Thermoleophilia bacterium]|nr:universal stress protein [Thermoleophilia bacterium]
MASITRIVYCTDFSANADAAFAVAQELAAALHARLYVLHVVSGGEALAASGTVTWLPFVTNLRARLKERYFCQADVATEVSVRRGSPDKIIVAFASRENADLVVVGARGAGTMRGLLGGGSVAEKVVKNSPVPVLVVPK